MIEALGLVPIAIILSALLMLFRLNEAHKPRRACAIFFSSAAFAASLRVLDLQIAVSSLIMANLLALAPIAMSYIDESQELRIRSLISFQFLSNILLLLAVIWLDAAMHNASILALLALSTLFRHILPFSSQSLVPMLAFIPGSQRALYYLSSATSATFIAARLIPELDSSNGQMWFVLACFIPLGVSTLNGIRTESQRERLLYLSQICSILPLVVLELDTLLILTISCVFSVIAVSWLSQTNATTQTNQRMSTSFMRLVGDIRLDVICFKTIESALIRLSRISRRFFGPILVEWIFLRIPSSALVILRLLTRFISSASLPRVAATSIGVSIVILIFVLRL